MCIRTRTIGFALCVDQQHGRKFLSSSMTFDKGLIISLLGFCFIQDRGPWNHFTH